MSGHFCLDGNVAGSSIRISIVARRVSFFYPISTAISPPMQLPPWPGIRSSPLSVYRCIWPPLSVFLSLHLYMAPSIRLSLPLSVRRSNGSPTARCSPSSLSTMTGSQRTPERARRSPCSQATAPNGLPWTSSCTCTRPTSEEPAPTPTSPLPWLESATDLSDLSSSRTAREWRSMSAKDTGRAIIRRSRKVRIRSAKVHRLKFFWVIAMVPRQPL